MGKIIKKILSNGLTVISQNLPDKQSVTFYTAVKAGSRYETGETLGFAHFLEHMLFEGTTTRKTSRDLAEYLENIGGVGGAFTEKEYITYYTKVLPENYEIGIEYVIDILFHSTLPTTAIETEKGIVAEEIHRKTDSPEVEIWDQWLAWVFGEKSGIGQPTLGTVDQLKKINRTSLKNYMKNYYKPSNMIISIVGNFSNSDLNETYKKLSSYKDVPSSPYNLPSISLHTNHVKLVKDSSSQIQYIFGFVTDISHSHKDKFMLMLINDILGGGISARIFHKMVYESGISYFSFNYFWPLHEYGILTTSGGLSPQNAEKGVNILADCFSVLKEKHIEEVELQRAKKRMIANLRFLNETTDGSARDFTLQEITTNSVKDVNVIEDEINNITHADILRVCKKFTYKNSYLLMRGDISQLKAASLDTIIKKLE